METILFYLLKLSVSLSAVFFFYQLLLRKLTFYNWNRWFLLGYTVLSVLIPFVNIAPVLEKSDWSGSGMINWVPVVQVHSVDTALADSQSLSPVTLIALGLCTGMVIMFLRLVRQVVSFRRMMKKAVLVSGDGLKIFEVQEPISPFSFGNAIFINRQRHSREDLQEIIRHEFVHIRQKHSMDILWAECLCLLNWFNPFAWLLKKAIRQNLEYIADQQVLEHGIDKKEYQYLLLKVTGYHPYSIATAFNFSSLKKRIAMMNKIQSARIHLVRFLFILPLLAILLLAFRDKWSGSSPTTAAVSPANNDTIPPPPGSVWNEKGYQIQITDTKGNCTVVIRDRNKAVVEKLLLTEWNKKADFYENRYGQIPPPPPPPPPGASAPVAVPGMELTESRLAPPPPPAPAVPVKLPEHVQSIQIKNEHAVVRLKNGNSETYLLDNPEQLRVFEKKYGQKPVAPPPPKMVNGQPLLEERRLDAPVPGAPATIMDIPVKEE